MIESTNSNCSYLPEYLLLHIPKETLYLNFNIDLDFCTFEDMYFSNTSFEIEYPKSLNYKQFLKRDIYYLWLLFKEEREDAFYFDSLISDIVDAILNRDESKVTQLNELRARYYNNRLLKRAKNDN